VLLRGDAVVLVFQQAGEFDVHELRPEGEARSRRHLDAPLR
jgi:hypothetical protein